METTLHRKLVIWVFGAALAAALMMLAAAETAWARPFTFTEVQKLPSETYSDEPTLCQDELYTTTFSGGHSVVHVTYFEDTGAVHLHAISHAKVVAVPLDGTGPIYTGHTRNSDSENIRNVKRGELVEVDTDLDRFVAHGSDGSRAYGKTHAHFTFNANGVKTVDFDTTRMVCT